MSCQSLGFLIWLLRLLRAGDSDGECFILASSFDASLCARCSCCSRLASWSEHSARSVRWTAANPANPLVSQPSAAGGQTPLAQWSRTGVRGEMTLNADDE